MAGNNSIKTLISCLIFIFISGCGTNYVLTNKYGKILSTVTGNKYPNTYYVIDVTSRAIPQSEKKVPTYRSIFDLSERGQFELINEYAKMDTSSNQLRNSIIQPLQKVPPKPDASIVDISGLNVQRQITFFVQNLLKDISPSSRISDLQLEIVLKSDDINFTSISGFQTQYEYFDFGTVSRTGTRNFSIGAEISASQNISLSDSVGNSSRSFSNSIGPSANAGLQLSNSINESRTFRQRAIKQTGILSDKQVTLYMEGSPLYDLNGPITLNVQMEGFPSSSAIEFIKFKVESEKPIVEHKTFIVPYKAEVEADIFATLMIREVKKGGDTFPEGDDEINLLRFNRTQIASDFKIIESDDLETDIYHLVLGEDLSALYFFNNKTAIRHNLSFQSINEAKVFLNYILKENTNTIGDYQITNESDTQITISELKEIGIIRDVL